MMIWGKIVGVILGFPFGVFGVLFGVVSGALVDQVLSIRRNSQDVVKLYTQGEYIPRLKRFIRPAAAVALCYTMYSIDNAYDEDQSQHILNRISNFFRFGSIDSKRLNEFWQIALENESRLQVDWLVRIYGASNPDFPELYRVYSYSGEEARDFLFSTLHWIANSDSRGLSREEYKLFLQVFLPQGLGKREIQERLKSIPALNQSALQVLNLDPECSEQELKKRYRERAAVLHPDSSLSVGFEEKPENIEDEEKKHEEFARVQQAYEELLWQFRVSESDD